MRATFFSQIIPLASVFLPGVLGLGGLPNKIYGVNLGSWLVLESWMLPQEWLDMGGQQCSDCSTCIATEFAFAQAYPDTVDKIFEGHWSSWFNQTDVDALVAARINTLGYWIIEALVDRTTEFYPRGGLDQLRRGLKQLQKAGIVAILDHHALPGVAAVNQQFSGKCTSTPAFYTDANYHRALIWTSVMTTLSHVDPAFANTVAIEAVNEPIMDASQTPGYGDFQKNFVKVVRATEFLLGVPTPGFGIPAPANGNFTAMLPNVDGSLFTDEVRSVLKDAFPILLRLGAVGLSKKKTQLVTNFMDINWQWNSPSNPADASIGPQGYDNHLYYVFGGVADANPDAYMTSICNLNRVQNDAVLGNSPLWFGEWGLPVQFNTTDDFLKQWADAQKLAYGQGAGWIFWNFKVEISDLAGDLAREWSYLEGVRRGYLTKDPSKYNDPNVCAPYIIHPSASASASASVTTFDTSSTSVSTTPASVIVSDSASTAASDSTSATVPTASA
ncbi:glycoside hydrolase family 5 protein [Mycena albidolilacea]|uniref:Glycoside hydrolase family 5 protein n=1 Tax=Mycena albidolilacea TaxID=1033008 RepID=A0AAD7EXS3_9AGAR|nr:glycoside hydrolase family 5 protein [Mycena albidolilacea]